MAGSVTLRELLSHFPEEHLEMHYMHHLAKESSGLSKTLNRAVQFSWQDASRKYHQAAIRYLALL